MNQAVSVKRPVVLMLAITMVLMLAIPAGLVSILPSKKQSGAPQDTSLVASDQKIKVYLTEKKQVVEMPLEEYVKGVVAAEMPANFALEALKAQAIAARTNVVRRLEKKVLTPEGANVSDDHTQTQAYSSDEKLKSRWKDVMEYQLNMNKITQAVNETRGQILTYNGEPIDALFFSTSNGYTENSQDYFGRAYPYLRSVDSPWDKQTKHATDVTTFSMQDFTNKLGINAVVTSANQASIIKVLETSKSNRVKTIRVADKTLTGPQFREALGLYSSDFSWKVEGTTIVFTTHGYGHGVGMSQNGANGMAQEGKSAPQILTHFYQGSVLTTYKKT